MNTISNTFILGIAIIILILVYIVVSCVLNDWLWFFTTNQGIIVSFGIIMLLSLIISSFWQPKNKR